LNVLLLVVFNSFFYLNQNQNQNVSVDNSTLSSFVPLLLIIMHR